MIYRTVLYLLEIGEAEAEAEHSDPNMKENSDRTFSNILSYHRTSSVTRKFPCWFQPPAHHSIRKRSSFILFRCITEIFYQVILPSHFKAFRRSLKFSVCFSHLESPLLLKKLASLKIVPLLFSKVWFTLMRYSYRYCFIILSTNRFLTKMNPILLVREIFPL